MKLSTTLKTFSTTALLVVAMASSVWAADGKDYNASMCRHLGGSTSLVLNGFGGLSNFGNTPSSVICPAVRDEGGGLRGLVMVIDDHTSQNVVCTLKNISRTGQLVGQATRQTQGRNSAPQALTFNTTVTGGANASILYECDLPGFEKDSQGNIIGFARIISYEVDEQ